MPPDPRTYPKAASLVLAMAVNSACMPALDKAGKAQPAIPVEYPIVLRGEAPDYERKAIIERLSQSAGRPAILKTYRLDRTDTQRFVEHPSSDAQWWLVVPPAQRSGGYRLRVTLGDRNANACLVPPRGPATTGFEKPAYLVGLPRNVDLLRWHSKCP